MQFIISVGLILLLAGCGLNESPVAGGVESIQMTDGTRCVVYDGFYAGGIHCDWTRTR